jgi:hypothetical protein
MILTLSMSCECYFTVKKWFVAEINIYDNFMLGHTLGRANSPCYESYQLSK